MYFTIFHFHLNYVCIAWGLIRFSPKKVPILQINNRHFFWRKHATPLLNSHTTPLLKNCNILKFADIINVERYIFINNCFNKDYFSVFNENLKLVSTAHSYNTRSARNGLIFFPSYNTVRFGRK